MESYKYWAFISYSHRDRGWARWLHQALERYRVPRRLVGRQGPSGAAPRRIFPVFRDRDELPSSADLGRAIDAALAQSRCLILIASPHAAVSRWVDQEIARFRALGRGDRILCLIVDGEPGAARQPGAGLLECLPPSLREDTTEPIAADLRPGRDGRGLARLKLIAGLIGVSLDELRRRERHRQRLQQLGWAGAGLAGALLLAVLARYQQREAHAALAQQTLRVHIAQVYEKGRQELLAHNEARAAVLLTEAYRLGADTPALRFMLGEAMRMVDAVQAAFATGAPVRSVRYNPDGSLLLTRSSADLVQIWRAADGARLAQFALPDCARYYGPAFSRDGRLVYFGCVAERADNGSLSIWDAGRGRLLARLDTPPATDYPFNIFDAGGGRVVHAAADAAVELVALDSGQVLRRLAGRYTLAGFSRDGRRVITGDRDGEVALWDDRLRGKLLVLRGLRSPVVSLDDTPDGALVAAAAQDGAVRVWQTADGALRLVAGHPSPRPWLLFGIDGLRMLTKADDGARVWDTSNGALVYAQQFAGSAGNNFDISARGRWVMSSTNSRLALQDAQTGAELFTLDGHHGLAQGRDISEDDRSIATGGADGRVVLWRMPRLPEQEFVHRVDPLRWAAQSRPPGVAALFDPAGRWIASGGGDGMIHIWDAHSYQPLRTIAADPISVNLLALSDDGNRLASGGEVQGIKLWEPASGRLLRSFDCGGRRVLTLQLGPGAHVVAAAIAGGFTQVWDADSGMLLARFERDQARAGRLSPDGGQLAIGNQGVVRLWDLAGHRYLWSSTAADAGAGEIAALDFSRDGRRLLAAARGRRVLLLDAANGRLLRAFDDASGGDLNSIAFSHSGDWAVSTAGNGGAALLHLVDGQALTLRGHAGEVRSAQFSADDQFVLTAGVDGAARLWDAHSGALLGVIAVHASQMPEIPFEAAAFSADGRWVLSGAVDGTVWLSRLPRESRPAAALEGVLRCRVPWRLAGEELLPADPPAACSGGSG